MKTLLVLLILVGALQANVLHAQEDIAAKAIHFANEMTYEERARTARNLLPAEKTELIAEMKLRSRQNPAAKDAYTVARAFLDDEEAVQQLVKEFLENDAMGTGVLGTMQNPRIIELVAPAFFGEEPWSSIGSDVFYVPRSYRAAELAVELLANSPAFNAEVINWARTLRGLTLTERRELIRPWWKENEKFFRDRNYKAIQPGAAPPRDPYAIQRREGSRQDAIVAPASPPSASAASPPIASATQSSTPSNALLWSGATAALVLLAGLLFLWKRRA